MNPTRGVTQPTVVCEEQIVHLISARKTRHWWTEKDLGTPSMLAKQAKAVHLEAPGRGPDDLMLTNCGYVANERDCVFICIAGRGDVEEGGGTLELQSIMLHSSARPSHHVCHCIRFKLQEQIYLKTSSANM